MTAYRNVNTGQVVTPVDEEHAAWLARNYRWQPYHGSLADQMKAAKKAADTTEDTAPKKPNTNAPKSDWAAYAAHLGIDINDEAKKDDIIAAVKNAEK